MGPSYSSEDFLVLISQNFLISGHLVSSTPCVLGTPGSIKYTWVGRYTADNSCPLALACTYLHAPHAFETDTYLLPVHILCRYLNYSIIHKVTSTWYWEFIHSGPGSPGTATVTEAPKWSQWNIIDVHSLKLIYSKIGTK